MGDVVNLNKIRKIRAKEARADCAAENRVRHGIRKQTRQTARVDSERAASDLDGKRLD